MEASVDKSMEERVDEIVEELTKVHNNWGMRPRKGTVLLPSEYDRQTLQRFQVREKMKLEYFGRVGTKHEYIYEF